MSDGRRQRDANTENNILQSLADNMDVEWGGIWGHVRLEARANAWLSDLFVQPDVANSSCSASATFNGKSGLPDAAKLEVFDQSGRRIAETSAKPDSKYAAGQPIQVEAKIRRLLTKPIDESGWP